MSTSSASISERQALMVLSALPDFGPITVRRCCEVIGATASALFVMSDDELRPVLGSRRARILREWARYFDLKAEEARLRELGCRWVIPGDVEYPELLTRLVDAPLGLYHRGPVQVAGPSIAIVGTRHVSQYGLKVTRQLTTGLVRAGFTIVSGLAAGVDAEAHRTALECDGKTVAVLGTGIDRVYPSENRHLHRRMSESGGLYSEFYLGRPADRQTFPQRNRIVSGMAHATLVVETAARGGSLITARFAMEQNRTVFSVPGRIDQPSSRGCLDLIRDGATLVTCVDDILEELRFMQLDLPLQTEAVPPAEMSLSPAPAAAASALGPEDQKIARVLAGERLHPDQICERTGLASFQVHAALMMLELQRRVAKNADGTYEATD